MNPDQNPKHHVSFDKIISVFMSSGGIQHMGETTQFNQSPTEIVKVMCRNINNSFCLQHFVPCKEVPPLSLPQCTCTLTESI